MMNFRAAVSKKCADARSYIREQASGNGIKYSAERAAKHYLYIPVVKNEEIDSETGNVVIKEGFMAISGDVHEWNDADGRYKATMCTKGKQYSDENGNVILDGSCPFCDRIAAGWDIYKLRKEDYLKKPSVKTGADREKEIKEDCSKIANERKCKEPSNYIYILAAKIDLNSEGMPVVDKDGVPTFTMKVLKYRASKLDKIQKTLENSGIKFEGAQFIVQYGDSEDPRQVSQQATFAPVFGDRAVVNPGSKLLEKIDAQVAKFTWDGIEKAYPEWAGMTLAEAKKVSDNMYRSWDEYKAIENPDKTYLEYIGEAGTTTNAPAIGAGIPGAPALAGMTDLAAALGGPVSDGGVQMPKPPQFN